MIIPPAIGIIAAPVKKKSQESSVNMFFSKVIVKLSENMVAKVPNITQRDSAFYMPLPLYPP